MPAWKSVSCERHDDERGVGVQLAQLEQVVAARPSTLAGMSRPAELSWSLRPRAGGGDDDVDVEPAHRLDQRRVVAQLLADGADQRAVAAAAASTALGPPERRCRP